MATSTFLASHAPSLPFLAGSPPRSSASNLEPQPYTCPNCFTHLPDTITFSSAQDRILELEAQVKLLNSKAAAAVDKLADYEDEVQLLRAHQSRSQSGGPSPAVPPEGVVQEKGRLSSFSSLLGGRRGVTPTIGQQAPQTPVNPNFSFDAPSPTLSPPPPPDQARAPSPSQIQVQPPSPEAAKLSQALQTEQELRARAENALSQSQVELEELTAQLFSQANEMVATERKARAKLEERVLVLEKRDVEKRKRLERLEGAIKRIERVRGMVG